MLRKVLYSVEVLVFEVVAYKCLLVDSLNSFRVGITRLFRTVWNAFDIWTRKVIIAFEIRTKRGYNLTE